ncbi:MAG TPA: type II secretion system F family protein [Candidatus Paceibacterota bacterium]|nr:type II secretion system F family protein [Candidatus Paceibacterota bacterium]
MKFRVTTKTAAGEESTQVVEAASRFAVYEQAEKEGSTVLSVAEGGGSMPAWTKVTFGSGVKTEQKINFTKNLAAMIAAGLTLTRALSVIERQSTNKYLKKIVIDLEDEVKKGSSFHEALAKHPKVFSKLFIAMTKAGEESGTLADSLAVVARQMDKAHALQKKVKGAMIYPSIILSAIVIIGVLMMIYVVPTLSNTFKELGVELPTATRVIIETSDFMAGNALLTLGLLLGIFGGLMLFLRSKLGAKVTLWLSLRMPVIGELVRETMSARAARAMSSLLSSGVEMLTALQIAGEVTGDNSFGKVIREAEERVRKGETLSISFSENSKLYPVFMGDMIAVGEETGKVADMLGQVAQYYELDVEERTKDLSTIIEPLLMLFIGGAVGIFAMAMITPIYSLSDKI